MVSGLGSVVLLWSVSAGSVPVPLPDRPGNVSLEGETVSVALPEAFAPAVRWEAVGLEGQRVAQGECRGGAGKIELGRAPVGWYRIDGLDASGKRVAWTTAAVLKKLAAPVPSGSPVRIDTANAWFTHTGKPDGDRKKMEAFASLAALAGVSGARDRLTWGELEPAPGSFKEATRYDDSARILRGAGLEVLQVFHSTPAWAQTPLLEDGNAFKRFPRDLRDAYRFCQAMAGRFKGAVQAWEPWNEANIPGFGGQLIDEMCALQKASYLGFKAGDPDVTVCWNVYAGSGSKLHAQGVVDNVSWPYYDTYNNHTYSGVEQYAKEFETAREGACGRPLWISECGVHVRWDGERGELPEGEEVRQARFVPKSYASSLFAGVSRHYFFILGNYCEGQIQFGLLRHDLTPRRGYLALAAVGRLLAGAQPLGCMTNGAARVYAFRARPDGEPRDVLVAWNDGKTESRDDGMGESRNVEIETAYDVYGRVLTDWDFRQLGESPVFLVLPVGGGERFAKEKPLGVAPEPERLAPSPVVMQALMLQARSRLDIQAYEIGLGAEETVPVAVYNFSGTTVRGKLAVLDTPAGWKVSLPVERLELRPMERQVVALKALIPPQAGRGAIFGSAVRVSGDFGPAGKPALAFRLACAADEVAPAREVPIASVASASAWTDNIVGGAKMTHEARDGRMLFTMDFGGQDPWGYPKLALGAGGRPPAGADGLLAEIEVLEGEGTLRVQFVEESGACYLSELPYDFKKGGRQKTAVFFEKATWGGHSRPDPDGKLTPAEIHGVMVGINAKRDSRVRLAVGNLRWVAYD
jgi:hypothetical protein